MQRIFYTVALLLCLFSLGFMVVRYAVEKEDVKKPLKLVAATSQESAKAATSQGSQSPLQIDGNAYIAIILDDVGINKIMLEKVWNLPSNITLGFSPYPEDVNALVQKASNMGFNALIKIPMQSSFYPMEDLGPYMLLDDLEASENQSRLDFIMSRSDEIVGVYLNPGEVFTDFVENVVQLLRCFSITASSAKKNMTLLYMDEQDKKPMTRVASDFKILDHLCLIDLTLDDKLSKKYIERRLEDLEAIARSRKVAVGILSVSSTTLNVLEEWMQKIEERNVYVKPITFIMHQRALISSSD